MDLYLGELEQLVLLAVIQLDDEAYGVSIQRLLSGRAGRNVALPTVYTTIDRLETKGVLDVRLGDSTPERGGRRKRLCRATPAGLRALKQSMASTRALAQGLRREFRP